MREFPFAVDNSKRNIFIWGSGTEVQKYGFIIPRFLDNFVRWCFRFVDEIRVEDVKLHKDVRSGLSA